MKRCFLGLIFLGISCVGWGQNWAPIKTQGYGLFKESVPTISIVGVRIDSTWIQNEDTVFQSFPTFTEEDYFCINTTKGSWLGKRTIRIDDTNWVFINRNNDSILIKTVPAVGNSWTLYTEPISGNRIEATISEKIDSTFFGIHDSIVTIHLEKKDSSGNVIPCSLNSLKLTLSRQNGLLRFPNFFDFPEDLFPGMIYNPQYLTCVGFSQPEAGLQNITTRDVYDAQTGDEFHTHYTVSHFFQGNYGVDQQNIYRILERMDSQEWDTIRLKVERCWYRDDISYTSGQFTHSFSGGLDTLWLTWAANAWDSTHFDRLPGELVGDSYLERYFMTESYPSGRPAKVTPSGFEMIFPINDTCGELQMYDGCSNSCYYYKGIPDGFYNCTWMMNTQANELIYFNIGGETWGTPFDCSTLGKETHSRITPVIDLIPNPVSGKTRLRIDPFSEGLQIDIYDIVGRPVFSVPLMSPETELDCSSYSQGVYILKISGSNGIVSTLRFIVTK